MATGDGSRRPGRLRGAGAPGAERRASGRYGGGWARRFECLPSPRWRAGARYLDRRPAVLGPVARPGPRIRVVGAGHARAADPRSSLGRTIGAAAAWAVGPRGTDPGGATGCSSHVCPGRRPPAGLGLSGGGSGQPGRRTVRRAGHDPRRGDSRRFRDLGGCRRVARVAGCDPDSRHRGCGPRGREYAVRQPSVAGRAAWCPTARWLVGARARYCSVAALPWPATSGRATASSCPRLPGMPCSSTPGWTRQ